MQKSPKCLKSEVIRMLSAHRFIFLLVCGGYRAKEKLVWNCLVKTKCCSFTKTLLYQWFDGL